MTDLAVGTVLNDRYQLEGELGRGGMGIVYRAHDTLLDRDVAVKMVSGLNLGTEGRARLLGEAKAIAKLNHPHIVAVYDAGEVDKAPFVVMELIAGTSLHDDPPKEFESIVAVASDICRALEHAHGQGIVHRDLKPENVVLLPDGTAKLMDFGIARSVTSRMTSEGNIIGTVFYLAPELALGQEFDGRADLYALGVMLYELTTGSLPFSHSDPLAVISQHLHASVVPPRAKRPEVPPLLDELILRLMSKRPDDRPASAAEVLEALLRSDLLDPEARAEQELRVIDRIARGRFIGREQEFNEARELWGKAAGGQGQTLLISGEPGIGKTRLMRELSTHVEVTGGRALVGTCYAEGGAPYAPFAQIVRRTLGKGGQNGHPLPEFVLADLLSLAPDLKPYYPELPPNPPLEPQAEQQRLFENVVAYCSTLSEESPLMLVLDDAHWADSGSLSMLRHLARRTRRNRVLLMATYREVELNESRPFHEVMLDLNRERLATRLKLARLTREETQALLTAIFEEEITPDFLDAIYRETEGNPFFIEEVCKTLVEEGKLYFENGRWHRPSMDELEIPQSVRVAIQSRITTMPEQFQETLRLAAILGREFDYDTLAKASEVNEDTLIEALEAATHAQLIEEVSGKGGVTFSFLHALIPATLEESVHTLRRRKLHRQAAAAIESLRPEDHEALAYHYGEAGDEAKALGYYTQAGERALAAYANQEAEGHFRAALNLVTTDAQRAPLLAKLGLAQATQARFEEAIETWKSAIGMFTTLGEKERLAWCYARAARAAWDAGDFPRGLELSKEGMRVVEGAPESIELADLIHETARAYHFNGMEVQGEPLSRQAREMAERLGATKIQVEALTTWALFDSTPTDDAIAALERAVELARANQLPEQEARARNNLAIWAGVFRGQIGSARQHLRQAAQLAQRTGQVASELFYTCNEVSWAIAQGDLSYAEAEIGRLTTLSEEASQSGIAGLVFRRLEADLWRAWGKLDAAIERYREGQTQARDGGLLQDVWTSSISLGEVLIETGDLDAAEPVLQEALEIGDKIGIPVWARLLMARLHTKRGEPDPARRFLQEAEEKLARRPSALETASSALAKAQLAQLEGRWDEAWGHFDNHIEQLATMGLRHGRALALREQAEAHLARGEPEDGGRARELLEQARAEFESMGALAYVDKISAQLKELPK
ncbi:MAG: serine/threonine-protein kinase PknK [Anaerolineales bacterium]